MRKELEKLKSGSAVGRLLYVLFALGGRVLPSARRERIVRWVKCVTRYRPPYARRVKGLGVTTEKRSPQVIVSLTSYPARIGTVHRVITALLNQTFKPDKVVLWLGEDKFPRREAELPRKLLRLCEHGLTIGWCKDLRSYTKLIPSLKAFPDDIIVTADDDTFYAPQWLGRLYDSFLKEPKCVHSTLALKIGSSDDGSISSYSAWQYNMKPADISKRNFLLGFSGVLYPSRCLDPEVFNESAFKEIAPSADDIWFWAMAIRNGTSICPVADMSCLDCDGICNQDSALANENVSGVARNDEQFRSVVDRYKLVF